MKKILMAAAIALTMCASAVTQVYNYTSSVKVPYLNNGVRTYASRTLKGTLTVSFDEDGVLTNSTLNVQNKTSKVWHKFDFTQAFYNLMGKRNKQVSHATPTVAFAYDMSTGDDQVEMGCEKGAQEPHEKIVSLDLAGTGTLKYTKTVIKGCGTCGLPTTQTEYCSILQKMCGNLVGVMDCECPDEDSWMHTVEGTACGPRKFVDGVDNEDDLTIDDEVRTHYASIWGTWSATYSNTIND